LHQLAASQFQFLSFSQVRQIAADNLRTPGSDSWLERPMAEPATNPPRGAATVTPPTVLLVDDEPSVLSALRRLFRSQGYRIEQATSGAEALLVLAMQPVDLVISDMRMPEMDGAALLAQVRQNYPGVVRILLTGYADISATIAAINQGAIHRYIAKPWDDQEMLMVVGEALRRRELEQENTRLLAITQAQNDALAALNQSLEERVTERTEALELSNSELAQAHHDIEAQFTLAVTVFSGLLEMRQDGIAGHARRVSELAQRTAARLGLDAAGQREVQLAALLHDIGKIGFPDAMLGKPVSKFNAEEMARYQRHPADGEAALMPLDKLQGVAAIVRQHHERFDGRGFPDGLRGPGILLGARILAAASDYDGLISGSQAERVFPPEVAKSALREAVNGRYDPVVVEALVAEVDAIAAAAQADIEVGVANLRPGMKLAADLLTAKGVILLPAGHVFQAPLITKLRELAERQNLTLTMRVARSAMPKAASSARAVPA
jgi:response regulator RpfG family c-di-GMP phosphodiesterase